MEAACKEEKPRGFGLAERHTSAMPTTKLTVALHRSHPRCRRRSDKVVRRMPSTDWSTTDWSTTDWSTEICTNFTCCPVRRPTALRLCMPIIRTRRATGSVLSYAHPSRSTPSLVGSHSDVSWPSVCCRTMSPACRTESWSSISMDHAVLQ